MIPAALYAYVNRAALLFCYILVDETELGTYEY